VTTRQHKVHTQLGRAAVQIFPQKELKHKSRSLNFHPT